MDSFDGIAGGQIKAGATYTDFEKTLKEEGARTLDGCFGIENLDQGSEALTVAGLLGHLQIKAARVAVEVNESVVIKDRYETHRISPGDSIEIVAFVGGG